LLGREQQQSPEQKKEKYQREQFSLTTPPTLIQLSLSSPSTFNPLSPPTPPRVQRDVTILAHEGTTVA
jgi:hypothetical protein